MKKLGLRTKLNFRFDTEDMEFDDLDFIVEDPKEERKQIKTVRRRRRSNKKKSEELF